MKNTIKNIFYAVFVVGTLLCNIHVIAQEAVNGVADAQGESQNRGVESAEQGAGVVELSNANGMRWNDVGVLVTSDGSITVSGKGTLPTEIKAMAYGFVTAGDEAQHNTTLGGIIDLDELMNGGAKINGLHEGDMLKFYFSEHSTLKDLEGNSVLHNSINWNYDSVAASGNQSVEMTVGFNQNALGGKNPYQGSHDGTLNITVYSYKTKDMVAGQPLPGPMGLLASGFVMLWGFRRKRLVN